MQMNKGMTAKWNEIYDEIDLIELEPSLKSVLDGKFIESHGAVLLETLASNTLSLNQFEDITRFEAISNKIHIKDYLNSCCDDKYALIQGLKYSIYLKEKLIQIKKPSRIILSLDPDSSEISVKFFVIRQGKPYGSDNPEDYQLEDIAIFDINN